MPENLSNMRHARSEEQREVMERGAKDGVCTFCEDFCRGKTPTYHPKPVIKTTEWWSLTENMEPYHGAERHFLLVYNKEHVVSPSALSGWAWGGLGELVGWVQQEYSLPAGALVMRFGDTDYTGGSVEHLHAHLLFGGEKQGEALRVKLGYVRK